VSVYVPRHARPPWWVAIVEWLARQLGEFFWLQASMSGAHLARGERPRLGPSAVILSPGSSHLQARPGPSMLERDLDGISCLLGQNLITGEQARVMAARARSATQPATPRRASPWAPSPPAPVQRLRSLSDDERWQALVGRAVAASAGLAW
jgi:hypothetical protein